jgi:hypothetical protein
MVQATQNKVNPLVLGVEVPGDQRGQTTGTRYSSQQELDAVRVETPAIIGGKLWKTAHRRSYDGLRTLRVDGHSTGYNTDGWLVTF